MNTIPGLTDEQLSQVQKCLPKQTKVKLFGSRVKGNFRQLSDLDVCIMSDLSRAEITKIIEAFEESDLPFTVDVVLYGDCSDEFKSLIDSTGIEAS